MYYSTVTDGAGSQRKVSYWLCHNYKNVDKVYSGIVDAPNKQAGRLINPLNCHPPLFEKLESALFKVKLL